jgi:hypothetical protein
MLDSFCPSVLWCHRDKLEMSRKSPLQLLPLFLEMLYSDFRQIQVAFWELLSGIVTFKLAMRYELLNQVILVLPCASQCKKEL